MQGKVSDLLRLSLRYSISITRATQTASVSSSSYDFVGHVTHPPPPEYTRTGHNITQLALLFLMVHFLYIPQLPPLSTRSSTVGARPPFGLLSTFRDQRFVVGFSQQAICRLHLTTLSRGHHTTDYRVGRYRESRPTNVIVCGTFFGVMQPIALPACQCLTNNAINGLLFRGRGTASTASH